MKAGEESPAAGPFPDDVISRLLRRLVRSGGLLERHDRDGIQASLSELLTLGDLAATSGLTQAELGDRLALEKSTVSRLVSGLERRGLVTRRRDPANRRFVRLHLTPAGDELATRIGEHLREQHQLILSALTAEELEGLSLGLTGLARVLDQHRG